MKGPGQVACKEAIVVSAMRLRQARLTGDRHPAAQAVPILKASMDLLFAGEG